MQENLVRQNIIITERCQSLRQLGRNALRGRWGGAIIAVIIYMLVLFVPTLIFDNLFGLNMANVVTDDGFTYNMDAEFYQQLYNSMPQMSMLSSIWILLVSGPMVLGITIYFLASFRGHDVGSKDVFLGFERFGKALGLMLYQALFIFLWSLLFIIPGIIASFRYSQSFYVLADDPSKSIRECVDESKFMMKGNKGKYFLLCLSFIGWMILASVPAGIIDGIMNTLSAPTAAVAIVSLITSLFMAPVYAYLFSTQAGFYEILSGHLIKETEPVPISPEQIETDAPVEKIEEVIEEVVGESADESDKPAITEEPADPALPQEAEAYPEADILPEPLNEEDKYND